MDYFKKIPDELKSGLIENNLVIFIGSGISFKSYNQQKSETYYPLFKGLCEEIIDDLQFAPTKNHINILKNRAYDQLLGIMEDLKLDVHESAARILSKDQNKKVIKLHKKIIEIFQGDIDLRIVTTNFDNLINIASKELYKNKVKPNIYEAPALFPGRERFKGICYLHGHVSNPYEMILTDKDLGKAYMDEGWALRFAHELFQNFSVLFIGYGLNDIPLRFLSLALAGQEKKFNKWAFISNPDKVEDWKRLGVEPIVYEIINGSHRILYEHISEWVEENKKDFIDKRKTLCDLADIDPTTLPPHQLDLALNYFKNPHLLREFAKNGFKDNWFKVLEEHNYMAKLYHSDDLLNDDFSALLADQLINAIISNPQKWTLELGIYKNTLNPRLFDSFCRKYESETELKLDNKKIRLILEFFRPSIEKGITDYFSHSLTRLLKDLIAFDLVDDAVWLLVLMLEVNVKAKKSFNYSFKKRKAGEILSTEDIDSSVTFRGQIDAYLFKKYKDELFSPFIEQTGYKLIVAISNKFQNLLINMGRIKPQNYTYIGRPIITESKQYFKDDVLNVFIDSIVEIFEEILILDVEMAELIVRQWEQIDEPYFNRLTLYGLKRLMEIGFVQ